METQETLRENQEQYREQRGEGHFKERELMKYMLHG